MKRPWALVLAVVVVGGLALLLYLIKRPGPERHAPPGHSERASGEGGPAWTPSAPTPRPGQASPTEPDQAVPAGGSGAPAAPRPGYKEYAVDNPDGTTRIVRDHRGEAPPANLPKVPLKPETFAAAQLAAKPAVDECAKKLPTGVGLGGHVGVVARITSQGGTSRLSEPRIKLAGFQDQAFETCMNQAIAATSFATPDQTDATYEAAMSFPVPERP